MDIKKFIKKLYELVGASEGVKVNVKAITLAEVQDAKTAPTITNNGALITKKAV